MNATGKVFREMENWVLCFVHWLWKSKGQEKAFPNCIRVCVYARIFIYRQAMQHRVTVTLESWSVRLDVHSRGPLQVLRFALTQRLVCSKLVRTYILLECESQNASRPGILNLSTIDIRGWIIFHCGGCPLSWRVFGCIPGLHSLNISNTHSVVTRKNVSAHH